MSNKDDGTSFLKRKTYPATLSWREEGDLLRHYLECYVTDKKFAHALVEFCEGNKITIAQVGSFVQWWRLKFAHEPIPDDVRQYVENVGIFAATYHLDYLSEYRGHDAVMWWCWLKQNYPGTTVKQFVTGAVCGGFVPSVGEKVFQRVVQKAPNGDDVEYDGFDIRPPTIRISVESPWEAEWESPAAIYERLMQDCREQIIAQLTRWYHEFGAGGYIFGDTKTEVGKYASWTYRRATGEHFKDIAEKDFAAAESVRLRTNEFAKAIGLSFPRTRRRVHE